MSDSLSDFLEEPEFGDNNMDGDDLFAIFESLDSVAEFPPLTNEVLAGSKEAEEKARILMSQRTTSPKANLQDSETELETSPKSKKRRIIGAITSSEEANPDGNHRISHITVERNRRKQMNEHLSVLRSLMPCFYVKRGDQASIIGSVVDYINELRQILQSLEAKKQRKVYSEVLSPRLVSSPLSPRKPLLSPRLALPRSPRTPQPVGSPSRPRLQPGYLSPTIPNSLEPSPASSSSTSIDDDVNELVANSKSAIAKVEVKFSGPNVVLKTLSPRIPGQAVKIISALEDLSLEILEMSITTPADETVLNIFTVKIGIECQLSADELAQQIQQTFC